MAQHVYMCTLYRQKVAKVLRTAKESHQIYHPEELHFFLGAPGLLRLVIRLKR